MRTLDAIGQRLDELSRAPSSPTLPGEYLALGEEVLEHWVIARDMTPTDDEREGFRLLALHRQGAEKLPSFNACRETCRELAFHYNLLTTQPDHPDAAQRSTMMGLVANHLYLFVRGKMEVEELGDFCCASRPIREKVDAKQTRQ
ncbi:MAG: hypothetical protein HKO85_01745 [Xanthomonadales bacterium]|nr:hypothetical protein [Gammaproteobacteria bacterium]MBT8050750.1 hypothetical protein [Gammaproteobacteria bacterium]MBT8055602.1 hypothetical protein [Gammaproteobacteria bacterium]NNJ80054.1 hypothetical protein [Xanthomonadales bacterium]NNL03982.1 hypothetical protein [Xanthomonadales bacterium]